MKLMLLLMVVVLCDQVHGKKDARNSRYNLWWCHYKEPQCKSSEFNCACEDYTNGHPRARPSSECIPQSWVCDAYKDCRNGADELGCVCSPGMFQCNQCNLNESSCIPIHQCIPNNKVCDSTSHCVNRRDEYGGQDKCKDEGFKCDNGQYISSTRRYDGYNDCRDGSDERRFSKYNRCDSNKLTNNTCVYGECYYEYDKCDGYPHCIDHSDELNCPSICPSDRPLSCACNQIDNYTCTGIGYVCHSKLGICDSWSACSDHSDESNCACPNDLFTCTCFRKNKPTCNMKKGCISKERVNDGNIDCDSGNDENVTFFNKVQCGSCTVNILRLENEALCRSPACDTTTCFNVPALECSSNKCSHTDMICTSFCPKYNTTYNCNTIMQCEDQTPILNRNFCNGRRDCNDNSDETINRPGFKCSAKFSPITCVLPQWNLYDNVAQCYDRSDLCFDKDKNLLCFECLDKRLIISSLQVCDNVIDCYDLSDECLCENTTLPICLDMFSHNDFANLKCDTKPSICEYGNTPVTLDAVCDGITQCNNAIDEANCSKNVSTIKCESKWGEINAIQCDDRPECKDFKDECNSICNNPPIFCNNTCHSFYPLGDRYCDGYIDEAWIYLNNTNCPYGFDESNCPMRFECTAGKKVSIDVLQICDGIRDCDDGSDEKQKNCTDRFYCNAKASGLISISMDHYLDNKDDCIDGSDEILFFASPKEMIENVGLLVWLWIVAIITLLGNVYVICMSLKHLMDKNLGSMARCNHLLAINLSASDFLMGVYLLIIVVQARIYSGSYFMYKREWKTSSLCSLAGSLCVISSQTSSFMMSILAAHRLFNILRPFKARGASTTPWKLVMIFAWLTSIFLAILSNVIDYFKHAVDFPNQFSSSDLVTEDYVISFACRLASLTNTSITVSENAWDSVINFLTKEFPSYSPRDISYYGATSMCIPRFYVTTNDRYWIYSISIITLNFISFSFVVISYVFMWKRMSNRPINSKQAQKDGKSFQNRVTRLIVTDFCCWIPICVMAYLNIAGVTISRGVDLFTAGVLLPINSALNPLLYSKHIEDLFSKLVKRMQHKKEVENRNVVELQNIS